MHKKLILLLICAVGLIMSGCSDSRRIDTASLAETVAVDEKDGKTVYTFYIISSDDEVNSISVPAGSFKEAYILAKDRYIPDLSLAKFELFVVNEKIYKNTLISDLDFMSGQYFISPQSYVTLCDDNTMEILAKSKETPKQIEEHILLLNNKNKAVNITSLSIFNNFASSKNKDFYVSYINSENELKAVPEKIDAKK